MRRVVRLQQLGCAHSERGRFPLVSTGSATASRVLVDLRADAYFVLHAELRTANETRQLLSRFTITLRI
jgi:hypothetical protein